MFDRIKSAVWAFRNAGQFNLPVGDWESYLTELNIGQESSSGIRVTEANATRHATIFACINILARDMSALPLKLYEKNAAGGSVEVKNHPVAQWLKQPNPFQTPMQWRMRGWYSTLATGNQYERISRNTIGEIQTVPIDPKAIEKVVVTADLEKQFVVLRGDGTKYILRDEQVLHTFGLSLDNGITGVSPVRHCMETVGRALAVGEYGAAYFRSPVPKVIAKTLGKLDEKARDAFQQSWTDKFAGKKGFNTIALMPQGIEIDQIVKIPNNEAQFIETQKFSKEELAQIYMVPMHRLQALDRATFSNIEQQSLEYVQYALLPWLTGHEQAIERSFLTLEERDRFFIRHNVDALLRGDFKTRMDGGSLAINSAQRTPNEARALENLPAIEGGDDLLIPLNMGKLKDLQAPPKPDSGGGDGPAADYPDDEAALNFALNRAAGIGLAELRGADARHTITLRYIAKLEAALQPEIEAQGALIRDAGVPLLRSESRDALGFVSWLEEFARDREKNVRVAVAPTFLTMAEAIAEQAGAEIKQPADLGSGFAARWADNFAAAFTASTIDQLRTVAIEAQSAIEEDVVEAVRGRTREWEEGAAGKSRAGKEAHREGIRLASAVAGVIFAAAGYALVWATRGKNCPFCNAMRGKRVRGGQSFVDAGDFNPPGAAAPMRIKRQVKGPGLHSGCDCMLVPG